MHQALDDGAKLCGPCGTLQWHECCGDCGRRLVAPEMPRRDCGQCRASGITTRFCPFCGHDVAPPYLIALERGEVDLQAEAESAGRHLEAFLKRRPELWSEFRPLAPQPKADMIAVLNKEFGGSRG